MPPEMFTGSRVDEKAVSWLMHACILCKHAGTDPSIHTYVNMQERIHPYIRMYTCRNGLPVWVCGLPKETSLGRPIGLD
jgi:hypothetical protein